MIGANILLSGVFSSVASSLVPEAVSNLFSPNSGELQNAEFANLLNSNLETSVDQAPDIDVLSKISPDSESQKILDQLTNTSDLVNSSVNNAQLNSGLIAGNLPLPPAVQNLQTPVLSAETIKTIENTVSTTQTPELQSTSSTNTSDTKQSLNEVLDQALSQNTPPTPSNSDLTPVLNSAAEVEIPEVINETPKQIVRTQDSNTKKDIRILGEDNLNGLVIETNNKNIKHLSQVFEKDVFNEGVFSEKADNKKNESYSIVNENQLTNSFGSKQKEFSEIAKFDNSKFKPVYANENLAYKFASITKKDNGLELKLEPEALGKLEIKLGSANGKTSLSVIAERPETLELLKKDSSGLEKILNDNGIKADAGSLSFNLKGQNNFSNNQKENFYENPVAFNLNDILNAEQNDPYSRITGLSNYNNLYSNNLLNIIV